MIVTIARQNGAQGEAIGRAVADDLGWSYVDHEIIARAAAMANVSVTTIQQAQRAPSLLSRMMDALGRYPSGFELSEAFPGVLPVAPLSSDAYRSFIEQVIRQLEEGTDAVVIGHAAQAVLRGSARALHVFVTAPLALRARLTAAEEGVSPEEAAKLVRARDTERGEFFQRYYAVKWQDPTLYDLVLNQGRLSVSDASALVTDLVRARTDG